MTLASSQAPATSASQWATERFEEVRQELIADLKQNALTIGDVVLSSGQPAEYYVDAKRTLLASRGANLVAELVAAKVKELGATAVGGLTMGADPVVSATVTAFPGSLKGFYVRKEPKKHGLQKWIEGAALAVGERCLIVDDVVTTGKSIIDAINYTRDDQLEIVGVLTVLDRRAGGKERIREVTDAPYFALTTIDDVYPDRPDR